MKHYYYFVRNLGGFGSDDVVYKVAVGSSMREGAKCELLKCYARDCGFYFHQVSEESDRAIENLAKSLFQGSAFSTLYLRRANLSITDLYRLVIEDGLDAFEKNLTTTPQTFRLLSQLSPSFFFLNRSIKSITKCQPYRRKYLSPEKGSDITRALIGFCLILVLFIISGYLEGLERWTF